MHVNDVTLHNTVISKDIAEPLRSAARKIRGTGKVGQLLQYYQGRRHGATGGGDIVHFGGDEDHFKSILSMQRHRRNVKVKKVEGTRSPPPPLWRRPCGIIRDHRSDPSVLSRDPPGSWTRAWNLSRDPLGSKILNYYDLLANGLLTI